MSSPPVGAADVGQDKHIIQQVQREAAGDDDVPSTADPQGVGTSDVGEAMRAAEDAADRDEG
jgi:hypothetical protein